MVLILFVLVAGATAITFWMRMVPWVHVRVQDDDGKRIAISLPLPLTLADWGVSLARRFVKDEVVEHLDTATEFLKAMKGRDGYWHALPRDVARWWRARAVDARACADVKAMFGTPDPMSWPSGSSTNRVGWKADALADHVRQNVGEGEA